MTNGNERNLKDKIKKLWNSLEYSVELKWIFSAKNTGKTQSYIGQEIILE